VRTATALIVVALACSACGGSNLNLSPAAQAVPSAQKLTTVQRFHAARPAAIGYITALGHNNASAAQQFVGASAYTQLSTLDTLRTWFSEIPVKQLRVTSVPVKVKDRSAVGVKVVMSARLGPAPLTTWIKLGSRVLLVQDQRAGWRVIGDITRRYTLHQKIYGLSIIATPHFLSSPRLSVVYGPDDAEQAARVILESGHAVVKMLHAKYGGGEASDHPLIYLVSGLEQGERLAGVKIGRKETPAGWTVQQVAYIDYPIWLGYPPVDQDSTIAHELTHVATEGKLEGAPHSLLEGVAMYEEERYLHTLGYSRSFALIHSAYEQGFPSALVWGLRYNDWGLSSADAIEECYEDGEAMTAVILERYGGVPALYRLAQDYRAYHRIRYTQAQVDEAFQQALGVPFSTVVAQAQAYAAAHT
jgi:hypothetical protein